MKRVIYFILSVFMLFSIIYCLPDLKVMVQAETTINIGDYVQMGKYYDEPILWRCVGYDDDYKNRLMLSDKIITIKPFDAMGIHKYSDGTNQPDSMGYRKLSGSNLWETSNIRMWLNSTASAGNIKWIDDCPPTAESVVNGCNHYADEKGFLADGNFTNTERNAIMPITQKALLNVIDYQKREGGKENYIYNSLIIDLLHNYNASYYQKTTDNMFLLDVKQIAMVHQNEDKLGSRYYIGKPTQKALENAEINFNSGESDKIIWHSWLRSPKPDIDSIHKVLYVSNDGKILSCNAASNNIGVRPAFIIDLSSVKFLSGNGSKETPYMVDRGISDQIQNDEIDVSTSGTITSDIPKDIETLKCTEIYFKEKRISFTLPIQNVNGRTMYPLRECLEAMGAKVSWDESTNTAYGELNNNKIGFKIGKQKYTLNGIEQDMDVAPYLDKISQRLYIPLRYAAEAFGFDVTYYENNELIKIVIE